LNRRQLLILGSAVIAVPSVTRAQQKAMPVVGYLHFATPGYRPSAAAFFQGLHEKGYVEGENFAVEYRYAEGHYDRLPGLAADLVAHKVDVIAAFGPPTARAAISATSTIPIVFEVGNDPVAAGLVASLSRPGGNATGISILFTQVTGKRLDVLSQLVPHATAIAVLINPNSPTAEPTIQNAQQAASSKGLQMPIVKATTESEIDAAFASLRDLRAGGLVVAADPFFDTRREQLVTAAARHSIPTNYFERGFIELGGLVSYGTNLADVYREVGLYAARILKGEKPADLPVQQPTSFGLAINLKTAAALGLTVPQLLLAQADEVIE
jgi:putative tryptophan/tyrosine transport system substrate-binding protein